MRLIIICSLLLTVFVVAQAQEPEKTEPCADAQTQAEMTICWGKQYKAADATLNQVYRQLAGKLDETEKAQLKNAQTAWLKYRDANCEFVADQYKGGSMRPMIAAICLADMSTNRTNELKNQIEDRDH